jgi:hypothetical protein
VLRLTEKGERWLLATIWTAKVAAFAIAALIVIGFVGWIESLD